MLRSFRDCCAPAATVSTWPFPVSCGLASYKEGLAFAAAMGSVSPSSLDVRSNMPRVSAWRDSARPRSMIRNKLPPSRIAAMDAERPDHLRKRFVRSPVYVSDDFEGGSLRAGLGGAVATPGDGVFADAAAMGLEEEITGPLEAPALDFEALVLETSDEA